MKMVKVSPKFEVVIPRSICEALHIKQGRKLQVFQYENRIELIPIKSIKEMRGFLRGIDTTVARDKDRI